MNIREAIPVDAEEIANIHIAAWQFAYRGIMDDALLNSMDHAKKVAAWADAIENLGWSIYVSQHDGKITGFVHISEYRDNDMLRLSRWRRAKAGSDAPVSGRLQITRAAIKEGAKT